MATVTDVGPRFGIAPMCAALRLPRTTYSVGSRVEVERVLAQDSRFAPAANNLAYLLSETGGDKERALQLAQAAKEAAPDEPHVSDTLGWILHQRGVHQRAVTLLQEAANKLADNAIVRYHLGLAQLAAGNKDWSCPGSVDTVPLGGEEGVHDAEDPTAVSTAATGAAH